MSTEYNINCPANNFKIQYNENSNNYSDLPLEVARNFLSYHPSREHAFVCKLFYQAFVENIKKFNPNTDNCLIFQLFHKSILKNLINKNINYLEIHSGMVNVTERLYPFAKGLSSKKNQETKELLSQAENHEIRKIVKFWENCNGDLSSMSFNDIVLIDCILNGHHRFALEVFKIHPDYPLNISPWKMNGEVCENKSYTEVRKRIISCIGSYLLKSDKIHEFLAILGKEYRKITESHFEWGNLLCDNLKEEILKKLEINSNNTENIEKIFFDLFQKIEKKSDLAIGLALIYPYEELAINEEGESVYTKALQNSIDVYIDKESQCDLIETIINILTNN